MLRYREPILQTVLMQILHTALLAPVLYIIFIKLNQPDSRLKRIIVYCLVVGMHPMQMLVYFVISSNAFVSISIHVLLFLAIASLCNRDGSKLRALISAVYSAAMLLLLNFASGSFLADLFGSLAHEEAPYDGHSVLVYTAELMQKVLYLLWAIFYYRVARKIATSVPLSFSLLITIIPLVTLLIEAAIVHNVEYLIATEAGADIVRQSNLYIYGGLFGTLIFFANVGAFYLYVRLSLTHESLRFAQALAHTPPVWTAEQGLSTLFIDEYKITPREAQVIETMLLGKTDKEIATDLELAINTVQSHLKRIYKKTGATGRFALATLVRGE
jgi:DNA-binding CsgD family transcriptional regulator